MKGIINYSTHFKEMFIYFTWLWVAMYEHGAFHSLHIIRNILYLHDKTFSPKINCQKRQEKRRTNYAEMQELQIPRNKQE